jgi:hypothetical protein
MMWPGGRVVVWGKWSGQGLFACGPLNGLLDHESPIKNWIRSAIQLIKRHVYAERCIVCVG